MRGKCGGAGVRPGIGIVVLTISVFGGGCHVHSGREVPRNAHTPPFGSPVTVSSVPLSPPPVLRKPLRMLYRLTDVGEVGEPGEAHLALNNKGEVALTADTVEMQSQDYLWRAGRQTSFVSVSGRPDMTIADINDRGQAVGGASVTTTGAITVTLSDAVLWSQGKSLMLGTLPDLREATATAINNKGQVVGNSDPATPWEARDNNDNHVYTHVFLWDQGKMINLGEGTATAINDATQIAGQLLVPEPGYQNWNVDCHAALWERGTWRDLGTLPGGTYSTATALNAGGDVVGTSATGRLQEPGEAFLWRAGRMRDLGPGKAWGINARAQVVGESGGGAVLWWQGSLCDLYTCLRGAHGWVLTRAADVNDRGQIVGFGTHHGESHAFLLTPIPRKRLATRE